MRSKPARNKARDPAKKGDVIAREPMMRTRTPRTRRLRVDCLLPILVSAALAITGSVKGGETEGSMDQVHEASRDAVRHG
jgi:hypothetical protein